MKSVGAAFRVLMLCLGITGCSTVPHVLPPQDMSRQGAAPTLPVPPGPLVGIAFSGGGSRAATFSAAVLRELAAIDISEDTGQPTSVLEHTAYLSSVSGGSLAAAFYAARKPDSKTPMIRQGRLAREYAHFFDQEFLPAMQSDWEGPLIGAALGDAIPRADAIAQRWDERLFSGSNFTDLAGREAAGDSPRLILNGTSWDSGRRFVFTTLPAKAFEYDFVDRMRNYVRSHGSGDDLESLEQRFAIETKRFAPMTFAEINADSSELRLSTAIASSASVPLLIGPVTFSVQDAAGHSHLLHIGDGGMFDNLGIETLSQVMFPSLLGDASANTARGLMIVIDASYPFDGGTDVYSHASGLLSMLDKSPARISDIMEQRANAYQLLLWAALRTTAPDDLVPGPKRLTVVYLRHMDAYRKLAAKPPKECTQWSPDRPPAEADMRDHLSKIPTRFRLVSDCDAALLKASAAITVAANRQRIIEAARAPR